MVHRLNLKCSDRAILAERRLQQKNDVDLHHDDSRTAPSPGCFSNRSIYSPSAVASGDAEMQVDESLDLDLSTTQETHVVGSLNFDNLLRDATVHEICLDMLRLPSLSACGFLKWYHAGIGRCLGATLGG